MEDDELLIDLMQQQMAVLTAVCSAASNSAFLFDDDELDDQTYVDHEEGVRDQLCILEKSPSLFKVITNFTNEEFQELCEIVCPLITLTARSTGTA